MCKLKKYVIFFVLGAVGYALIELLWRGRTHWSMMIAGGICFIVFSLISRYLANINILYKAVIASICVTAIELIFGLVFNVYMKMNIWDYSTMSYNVLGQICPLFSLAWIGVAIVFIPIAGIIDNKLSDIE